VGYSIQDRLKSIYGSALGTLTTGKLKALMGKWRDKLPDIPVLGDGRLPADERDIIVIAYGDSIQTAGEVPLETLRNFMIERLSGFISGIHILPFSPYSSDDGFSVIDYRKVNPDWGDWGHISAIGEKFRLMADLVLNHCSAKGIWFKKFLEGNTNYKNFFITVNPDANLAEVFRPRALPLVHEFSVAGEKKLVWTTFSKDQVDLNFANPAVLLEFMDILLDYIARGVRIIRLDAIGFLWKEIGTSCIHHRKTHEIVKLFRLVLNELVPGVMLITETNVPYKENITYFGEGCDESHMVYQFTLPPLIADAYIRGDASILSNWVATLPEPNPNHTFFNFLASHDGIGVLPAKGYLSEEEIQIMVDTARERGGLIGYKTTANGEIPYELNISYRDAIAEGTFADDVRAAKFLSSQAIMLAMAGVPGIYIHSILGSGNWKEGVALTGAKRSINREKLSLSQLEAELDNPNDIRHLIFTGYCKLLRARGRHKAFHPSAPQTVLNLGPLLFAIIRGTSLTGQVLCLQSVSDKRQKITLPAPFDSANTLRNLVSGKQVGVVDKGIELESYQVLWLETLGELKS